MRRVALAIALAAACGCRGESHAESPQTGAKEAAIAYFTSLASGSVSDAYGWIDEESRSRVSAEAFARHAKAYRLRVPHSVDRVHVQACEENGDVATAHVILIGRAGGHTRRFQDAAALRFRDGKWGIVLPAGFGRG